MPRLGPIGVMGNVIAPRRDRGATTRRKTCISVYGFPSYFDDDPSDVMCAHVSHSTADGLVFLQRTNALPGKFLEGPMKITNHEFNVV